MAYLIDVKKEDRGGCLMGPYSEREAATNCAANYVKASRPCLGSEHRGHTDWIEALDRAEALLPGDVLKLPNGDQLEFMKT